MKSFAFLVLALTACTTTYNDRELGAPPRHPFNFKPVPPPTTAQSDTPPPRSQNPNPNGSAPSPSDESATPPNQRPIRDGRPDSTAPPTAQ